MPHDLTLPNLAGQIPYDAEQAIDRLRTFGLNLDAGQDALATRLDALAAETDGIQDALAQQAADGAGLLVASISSTTITTGGITVGSGGITLPTFTPGSVLFAGVGGVVSEDNANFFWDDALNRLGVGTASPLTDLHMNRADAPPILTLSRTDATIGNGASLGNIRAEGTGGGSLFESSSINFVATETWTAGTGASEITFFTTPTTTRVALQRMVILPSGNVGIGTTSPDALLELEATDQTELRITSLTTGNPQILLREDSLTKGSFKWSRAGFRTIVQGDATNPLTLNEDGGNVGIGLISPGNLLEIAVSATTPILEVSTWSTTATHQSILRLQKSANATIGTLSATAAGENLGVVEASGVDTSSAIQVAAQIFFEGDAAPDADAVPGRITFQTSDLTGLQDAMVITDGQDIGFGTTSPDAKVEVEATGQTELRITSLTVGNPQIILREDATSKGLLIWSRAGGRLILKGGGSDPLTLNEDGGNVGVGLQAPLARLHVDQASTTAAIPVLTLDQADISEELIEFVSTIGVGNAIEAVGAKSLTVTHFLKVTLPGALTRYIEVGTIA